MLIFDSFPSTVEARAFIAAARELEPELGATMYLDPAAAQAADPFPWELRPPIVHVERPDSSGDHVLEEARDLGADIPATGAEREATLERLVVPFGGRFAGT